MRSSTETAEQFDRRFDTIVAGISQSNHEAGLAEQPDDETAASLGTARRDTEELDPAAIEEIMRASKAAAAAQPEPRHADRRSDSDTARLDPTQDADLIALRRLQDSVLRRRFAKNVTVMFTGLVGSTAYDERHGDLKGHEKVLSRNALLFPLIENASGVIIKTIGEAIMVCFESADDALGVAAAMQHTVATHNQDLEVEADEIHIRVALDHGDVIAEDGDLDGDVVNVAARAEELAPADEIWVSDAVQRASSGWPIESVGAVTLEGREERTPLFRLLWQRVAGPDARREIAGLPARYELGDMLSHGSVGDLCVVRDLDEDRTGVVKTLHGFLAEDPEVRAVFHHAAADMQRLAHSGVARIVDCSPADAPEPFFVSERVPGTTLEQLVARHGCPPPEYAALIGYRVAQVVAYAHDHEVLHGDLRPEHVLINDDGGIRLINFGRAAVVVSSVARTGSTLGSPAYLAPEQILGAATDTRSDVYSLGALIYFLLCGRAPLPLAAGVQGTREVSTGDITPIEDLTPEVPISLAKSIGRTLAKVPAQRYDNMAALAAQLTGHFDGAGLEPKRDLHTYLAEIWPTVVPRSVVAASSAPRDTVPPPPAPQPSREPIDLDAEIDLEPPEPRRSRPRRAGPPHDSSRVSVGRALIAAILFGALGFIAGLRYAEIRDRVDADKSTAILLRPVAPRDAASPGRQEGADGTAAPAETTVTGTRVATEVDPEPPGAAGPDLEAAVAIEPEPEPEPEAAAAIEPGPEPEPGAPAAAPASESTAAAASPEDPAPAPHQPNAAPPPRPPNAAPSPSAAAPPPAPPPAPTPAPTPSAPPAAD